MVFFTKQAGGAAFDRLKSPTFYRMIIPNHAKQLVFGAGTDFLPRTGMERENG